MEKKTCTNCGFEKDIDEKVNKKTSEKIPANVLKNQFSDYEVEILKKIIKEYTSTINIDMKIEKNKRVRKTYNIDENLSKKILKEARKKGVSSSDILNVAVKEYFFNL